jgi:predicted Rossmann fold nucleotide-binding protein DprA/Smf involved in DNA uptake
MRDENTIHAGRRGEHMKTHSDAALATLLLTTHLIRRDSKPLSAGEYWELVAAVEDPAKLLAGEAPADERVSALLQAGTALALKLEELERTGIRALTPYDDGYPRLLLERLDGAAPPVLHVAGPMELLGNDGIGIVGSRNVGTEARDVAAEAARATAREGLSVISGVARGIDQVAMAAALEAGGTVVGIPADSLNKLAGDPNVRRAITDGNLCLATPYSPSAGFSVGGAMARNKLIYALARATLVVTSDHEKGGTWTGAAEALKRGARVAVWSGPGSGEGNNALIARGATAVTSVEEVFALEASPASESEPGPTQQLHLHL